MHHPLDIAPVSFAATFALLFLIGYSSQRRGVCMMRAVSEVIEIGAESIESPPSFGTSVRREFICGIGKVAKRFVIILDPDKAFDVEEMALLCESAQLAEAA